jgi:hypothetical protein
MSYIRFATNNLKSVLADKQGARCYFCLGHPNINRFVETVDFSTILCPECGIDAVVPASFVPNDTTLEQWHDRSFGLLPHQYKYNATVYRNEDGQVVVIQKSRGDIFGSVKFTGPLPKEEYPDEILRAENIKMKCALTPSKHEHKPSQMQEHKQKQKENEKTHCMKRHAMRAYKYIQNGLMME